MLTGFTFSARIKRVCIYHSGWCVYPIRAGQHLYPERGSTSVPSGAVPLSRARQYLCPERGVVPHPERGVLPHPERGVVSHLERGVLPHPERGVPPHPERGVSPHPERRVHRTTSEVYLPTRSGGTYTLARVVPTHSLEWDMPTNSSGTCTPKLYELHSA